MRWTSISLLCLCACRMGGTGGSALALVDPETDAGMEAGVDEMPETNRTPMGSPSVANAGVTTQDASVPTDDAGAQAPTDAAAAPTCAPTFADCDPLQNTGCAPLTQCMVDPGGDGKSGSCGFSNIPVDAGLACEQNPFGTSCPPKHGCVQGECLRYCVCDSDCNLGSSCSVDVLAGGGGHAGGACVSGAGGLGGGVGGLSVRAGLEADGGAAGGDPGGP